jgi:hypothetical protein
MLSAITPLAPTWHYPSTPLLRYLNIGRRLFILGANSQRHLSYRQSVHCAAPASPSTRARRISHVNLSRFLHNPLPSKRLLELDTVDKMADFEAVLKAKYPAKAHARRVVEYIRKKSPNATGTLYLESQKTRMIEDNDEPMPFRWGKSSSERKAKLIARN